MKVYDMNVLCSDEMSSCCDLKLMKRRMYLVLRRISQRVSEQLGAKVFSMKDKMVISESCLLPIRGLSTVSQLIKLIMLIKSRKFKEE